LHVDLPSAALAGVGGSQAPAINAGARRVFTSGVGETIGAIGEGVCTGVAEFLGDIAGDKLSDADIIPVNFRLTDENGEWAPGLVTNEYLSDVGGH
tara:strand:- start:331 stop:618 length:288 start_codon:yes stop_codon:yes gene_type:complete